MKIAGIILLILINLASQIIIGPTETKFIQVKTTGPNLSLVTVVRVLLLTPIKPTIRKEPFQDMAFTNIDPLIPLGNPGYRYEIRAKNFIIPGFIGFLYSYQETDTFDQIIVEVAAQDSTKDSHDILPDGGWTDARFNVWDKAGIYNFSPKVTAKQAVYDKDNKPRSLLDDQFHTYAIDWHTNRIEFYVDGVKQYSISQLKPKRKAYFHFGFRDTYWADGGSIKEPKVGLIDYFGIKKL